MKYEMQISLIGLTNGIENRHKDVIAFYTAGFFGPLICFWPLGPMIGPFGALCFYSAIKDRGAGADKAAAGRQVAALDKP